MVNRLLTPAEFGQALADAANNAVREVATMSDDDYVALSRKAESRWIGDQAAAQLSRDEILRGRYARIRDLGAV